MTTETETRAIEMPPMRDLDATITMRQGETRPDRITGRVVPDVVKMVEIVIGEDVTGHEGAVSSSSWAHQLARRRQQAHAAALTPTSSANRWITRAVSLLWSLVSTAVAQANAALAAADLPERIAVQRTSDEYRLTLPGPDGLQRHIAFFVGVRAIGDHASGGLQITTSETRARIYAVPMPERDRVRWVIPASGQDLTAQTVDDVLLSVFGDDPGATARLSASFSIGDGL